MLNQCKHADIKNTVITDLSQVVSDKVDNPKDNEERKLNITVFGVEESASNLKNKRNEDDTKVFIETFQNEVKTNISSKDIIIICIVDIWYRLPSSVVNVPNV